MCGAATGGDQGQRAEQQETDGCRLPPLECGSLHRGFSFPYLQELRAALPQVAGAFVTKLSLYRVIQPAHDPLAATKHFGKRRERPEQPERDQEQGDHQDPGKANLPLSPQLMQHKPGEQPDCDHQRRDPADVVGEPEELERPAEGVEDSGQDTQHAQGRTAAPPLGGV